MTTNHSTKMEYIYVVVENGEPYQCVYKTYTQAVDAVKSKHKETLDEDLRYTVEEGMHSCNVVDVPECTTGPSYLYIEKGISIYIYRLYVV